LRNRFFFIILATLILSAIAINFVHVYFFKNQRLKLIDRQINECAASLLQSEEFLTSVNSDSAVIENTISKVLQGARIGKVFVLRDDQGKITYQSFNVGLLKVGLPLQPEWVTAETEDEYVRIKNVPLTEKKNVTLQVGLVLDRNFLNWEILDNRVINYMLGIILSLFIASIILTLILLAPLRFLIAHLQNATSTLMNQKDVDPLPDRLTKYTQGFWARSDEFSSLLSTIQKLIDRINLNYKLTRSWTLQMAHELKTPLAIIRAETESKNKVGLLPEKYVSDVNGEIRQMSEIISQFLEWAELENSRLQKDLHALRIKSVVKSVTARLEKISPGRIHLQLESDFSVFSNPTHLDQLISNLLTNALKFSPESTQIEVMTLNNSLVIIDRGYGIPEEVKERIGQPFNVGTNERAGLSGNGLGLAWVATVAKLYQWKFEIKSSVDGTTVNVQFPSENID
jgi:signal transduction histidine kinase